MKNSWARWNNFWFWIRFDAKPLILSCGTLNRDMHDLQPVSAHTDTLWYRLLWTWFLVVCFTSEPQIKTLLYVLSYHESDHQFLQERCLLPGWSAIYILALLVSFISDILKFFIWICNDCEFYHHLFLPRHSGWPYRRNAKNVLVLVVWIRLKFLTVCHR